ncbi:MAG: Hpt domain-containing protein [Sulfitobacter sp.]
MIDWARVKVLRDEVGAENFDEVVELFLEEVDEVTARLKATDDKSTLEADLHFLKGSAMSLGFSAFSELCQTGETQSAQGQSDAVNLQSILTSYDISKEAFLAELPRVLST